MMQTLIMTILITILITIIIIEIIKRDISVVTSSHNVSQANFVNIDYEAISFERSSNYTLSWHV